MTIGELRVRCQATAPAPERETFTGKRARFFSIYLTALFIKTSITPNQITVLSMFVFFAGTALFIFPHPWPAVGAALFFAATVLDGCDGEVARYKKFTGRTGELYVEPVSHDLQYGLMFMPVAIGLFLKTSEPLHLILGWAAGTGKLLQRITENRHWLMTRGVLTSEEIKTSRQAYRDRSALYRLLHWAKRNSFSSNGLILPAFVLALLNRVDIFLWIYGVGFVFFWLVSLARQVRSLSKTDAVPRP